MSASAERGERLLLAPGPVPLLLTARTTLRLFSYGGGTQSNAVLALQGMGKLKNPYDAFIFANVGADSENPETLTYIELFAKPFCEKHNIKFIEIQRQRGRGKDKTPDTLMNRIERNQKSIVIPARMGHNGAPGNRTCTEDHKINVVDGWIKANKYDRAVIGLGISTDEFQRARDTNWQDRIPAKNPGGRDRKFGFWKRREYPLIDQRLSRMDCLRIIAEAGLPKPPKSSCFFCPFKQRNEWIEMKKDRPDLFEIAVNMEHDMNRKRQALGRDAAYLHRDLVPLEYAVGQQIALFSAETMDACDSGYCMT